MTFRSGARRMVLGVLAPPDIPMTMKEERRWRIALLKCKCTTCVRGIVRVDKSNCRAAHVARACGWSCWRRSRSHWTGRSSELTSGEWTSSDGTSSEWISRDWTYSDWSLKEWISSEWNSSQWTSRAWQCPGITEARNPDPDPAAVPGAWAKALVAAFEGDDWGLSGGGPTAPSRPGIIPVTPPDNAASQGQTAA